MAGARVQGSLVINAETESTRGYFRSLAVAYRDVGMIVWSGLFLAATLGRGGFVTTALVVATTRLVVALRATAFHVSALGR